MGAYTLADRTPVKPGFPLLKERIEEYTPEWASGITGIPAETIRRLAHEMGITARDQKIELPRWPCTTVGTARTPGCFRSKGFLLNHLIAEELPPCESGDHLSNSDPVTGQAPWFDVRVRVYKAGPDEPAITSPQFAP